jgi:hypothetical protein
MTIDLGSLDQDVIVRVVEKLLSDSGPIDRVEATGSWRTRNSAFWRIRAHPAGPAREPADVVFKVERRWDPEAARATHDALLRLSDLEGLSANVSFPAPLGWSEEPPGVLMPDIQGVEFFDVLMGETGASWGDPDGIAGVVRSCGEAMGLVHRLALIAPSSPGVRDQALQRLPAVIRWLLVRAAPPRDGSYVHSHNFSRNDFLVSADGAVAVLDPPIQGKPALLHEDVAWFTFQILSRAPRSQQRRLRAVFLDGYGSSAPGGPLTESDLRAVAICEMDRALGTAKRLILNGELGYGFLALGIALRTPGRFTRNPRS